MTSPAPASIAAGQTQLFTFTFVPTAPTAMLSFSVAASGTANVMVGAPLSVGPQTIDGGSVASAPRTDRLLERLAVRRREVRWVTTRSA